MNTIVTNFGTAQIKPLHDRLLVKRIAEKPPLIIIPDIARENSKLAEVVNVGSKVRDVEIGDMIMVPGAASKFPDWEQHEYIMIQQADIGGVFERVD